MRQASPCHFTPHHSFIHVTSTLVHRCLSRGKWLAELQIHCLQGCCSWWQCKALFAINCIYVYIYEYVYIYIYVGSVVFVLIGQESQAPDISQIQCAQATDCTVYPTYWLIGTVLCNVFHHRASATSLSCIVKKSWGWYWDFQFNQDNGATAPHDVAGNHLNYWLTELNRYRNLNTFPMIFILLTMGGWPWLHWIITPWLNETSTSSNYFMGEIYWTRYNIVNIIIFIIL